MNHYSPHYQPPHSAYSYFYLCPAPSHPIPIQSAYIATGPSLPRCDVPWLHYLILPHIPVERRRYHPFRRPCDHERARTVPFSGVDRRCVDARAGGDRRGEWKKTKEVVQRVFFGLLECVPLTMPCSRRLRGWTGLDVPVGFSGIVGCGVWLLPHPRLDRRFVQA